MATKSREEKRKLALKRETLRELSAVDLAVVVGGWTTSRRCDGAADTFGKTSYGC